MSTTKRKPAENKGLDKQAEASAIRTSERSEARVSEKIQVTPIAKTPEAIAFIRSSVEAAGLEISEETANQLFRYYELLVEWNNVMNLTAVTDFEEVVRKHFADSLTLNRAMDVDKIGSLIDVGTGAGFPGLPLAICYPQIKVCLVDSLNKRVRFLQTVVDELGLTNVTAIHARAEEGARRKDLREAFDCVVSRAVANLTTLSEYCLPFVKKNGVFTAYKSVKLEEELPQAAKALSILGGVCEKVETFQLFEMERSIVVIRKEKKTPGTYPRKAGMPSKSPLGLS
ncbi:MAG: 16S rRNA (guanine(527)-N(7))-methyltransferase RsmG [Lachnospiraceae bacterium]|nr:16S rRNA (guanine(527)-N(7))-methyltransferase RsmG [Lachnospiraceae bacterium]